MISAKLVQMIEDHWEKITGRVVHQLLREPRMEHLARLPESELRDGCQEILRQLGRWLAATGEDELARHFEQLGRTRRQEDVPLHEVVHAFHILKHKMLDFVRDQGLTQSAVELYAEEELEHQVGVFFDSVVYYVVRGYETALRESLDGAHTKAAGHKA